MNPNTHDSPATEVWRRFAGMFGRDAVARKFGETIPDEWHAMLSRLNEFQVQRGIRMLAYSGKGHVPSLPEFVKLCRDAEHDREVTDQPALPNPDGWKGDEWAAAANIHLLGVVTRAVMERRSFDARQTRILVKFKNLWADQIRLSAIDGGVPISEQQEVWAECMKRAEAEITSAS
jgi:hypothetical protein